eukprot:scpid113366/ scgid9360/ 
MPGRTDSRRKHAEGEIKPKQAQPRVRCYCRALFSRQPTPPPHVMYCTALMLVNSVPPIHTIIHMREHTTWRPKMATAPQHTTTYIQIGAMNSQPMAMQPYQHNTAQDI